MAAAVSGSSALLAVLTDSCAHVQQPHSMCPCWSALSVCRPMCVYVQVLVNGPGTCIPVCAAAWVNRCVSCTGAVAVCDGSDGPFMPLLV
jgi:hypothetical protein